MIELEVEGAVSVFGVDEEWAEAVIDAARDVLDDRRAEERTLIRRVDEVWPVAKAVARVASIFRRSALQMEADGSPWEVLRGVLGLSGVESSLVERLRALVEGRGLYGLPVLSPEATLACWGVDGEGPAAALREVYRRLDVHPVRGLVALAVLEDAADVLLDELGEAAERLSEGFRRAWDERSARLLGLCLCAWLSERLDGFEEWWEGEDGGWQGLYSRLRREELVERVVEERTGVRPGER